MEKKTKKLVTIPVDEKLRFNFKMECLKKNISMSEALRTAIKNFIGNK